MIYTHSIYQSLVKCSWFVVSKHKLLLLCYHSICYVDANGYLYFDAAGYENESKSAVYYSAKSDSYVDKDGNIYYQALDVSWDKDGKLVDAYDGEYLLD